MLLLRALTTVSLFLLATAPCSGVLIDFETFPGGPVPARPVALTNQYSTLGVTFSAIEDGLPVLPTIVDGPSFFSENAFSGTNFANNYIFGGSLFDDRADIFRMTFAGPATNVSFQVDPNGSQAPTFEAYDSGGTLLETLVAPVDAYQLIAFTSSDIARIDGIQPSDSWNYSIDDLQFDLAPTGVIPEPSTIAIWSVLGLVGVGVQRRRRRRVA